MLAKGVTTDDYDPEYKFGDGKIFKNSDSKSEFLAKLWIFDRKIFISTDISTFHGRFYFREIFWFLSKISIFCTKN